MSAALNDITAGTQAAVGYFVDQKKGEVNELKTLLKNLNVERDIRRKREIIKKVIAYMTLGIDVSRLFTDMIMAIETKDIVIKKMVYLYLCNYAHSEPEMAIMCINSLRRDCDNEDPLVRGLALRSLCSLRLESILEYVEQPLLKSFSDISAYVRKAAVMGVLKIHYLSPELVQHNGYIDQLYRLLQDPDANVVTNVIHVIEELKQSEGGLEVNQTLIMGLLNRIGEFSEWGLNTILDLVARYKPNNEEEIFAIMNLLDPVLRTANSGSVLSTLKCFLHLSASIPDLFPQIVTRAKPPLITLITGTVSESQYMTLKHFQSILHQPQSRGIFDDEYRQFFVRYNEPPHVKHLKVDLLPLITNATNAKDIATELSEYVTDVDSELSKRAILALGEIAAHVPSVSEDMTQIIVNLMDMDSSYIRSQAAIVLSNLIRIHSHLGAIILPHLGKNLKRIDEPEARGALIWMLGEFGPNILEAPYYLEQCIDNYEEETSDEIKLQVLTSSMKLFFKRAPEMQRMLGRLFQKAVNDTSNQDLHDRALLYYRLLTHDIKTTESLFTTGLACDIINNQDFAETKDIEIKQKIFKEFNTLAIIFNKPSETFIQEKFQFKSKDSPLTDFDLPAELPGMVSIQPTPVPSQPVPAAASVNLLDWGDDLTASAAPAVAQASSHGLILEEFRQDRVPPQVFQQKWVEWPDAFNGKLCDLANPPAEVASFDQLLRAHKIFPIASGPLTAPGNPTPIGLKYFAYATEESNPLLGGDSMVILTQILILFATKELQVTLKVDPKFQAQSNLFLDLLYSFVSKI